MKGWVPRSVAGEEVGASQGWEDNRIYLVRGREDLGKAMPEVEKVNKEGPLG